MASIEVREVRTPREKRRFLTFPWRLYRDDPLWVPPVLPERRKATNPQRGSFFRRGGTAAFAIAYRDGRPAGTICAAEDPPTNASRGKRECIFGFFEYEPDYEVFCALVEWAAEWGRARDLAMLYGPWNLDYEDSYGVLVEGWDRPPVLMCGHSPRYYRQYMERYGFTPARAANIAFAFDLGPENREVDHLARLAERVRRRGRITTRSANLDDWNGEVDRVHMLLQKSLGTGGAEEFGDSIPWHREQLEQMLLPLRDVVDPELVLFAEVDGEAVGWFPGVPDLNEHFKRANGLRYPWNALQMLVLLRRPTACLAIKSVLVLPEYQGRGASVLLFDEMARRASARGYEWVDLSITSEDNPNTPYLATRMGAKLYKKWQIYHYPISD